MAHDSDHINCTHKFNSLVAHPPQDGSRQWSCKLPTTFPPATLVSNHNYKFHQRHMKKNDKWNMSHTLYVPLWNNHKTHLKVQTQSPMAYPTRTAQVSDYAKTTRVPNWKTTANSVRLFWSPITILQLLNWSCTKNFTYESPTALIH